MDTLDVTSFLNFSFVFFTFCEMQIQIKNRSVRVPLHGLLPMEFQ